MLIFLFFSLKNFDRWWNRNRSAITSGFGSKCFFSVATKSSKDLSCGSVGATMPGITCTIIYIIICTMDPPLDTCFATLEFYEELLEVLSKYILTLPKPQSYSCYLFKVPNFMKSLPGRPTKYTRRYVRMYVCMYQSVTIRTYQSVQYVRTRGYNTYVPECTIRTYQSVTIRTYQSVQYVRTRVLQYVRTRVYNTYVPECTIRTYQSVQYVRTRVYNTYVPECYNTYVPECYNTYVPECTIRTYQSVTIRTYQSVQYVRTRVYNTYVPECTIRTYQSAQYVRTYQSVIIIWCTIWTCISFVKTLGKDRCL